MRDAGAQPQVHDESQIRILTDFQGQVDIGRVPDEAGRSDTHDEIAFVIELQSLGALVDLMPQEKIVHTETWEVYETNNIPKDLLGGKTLAEVLK